MKKFINTLVIAACSLAGARAAGPGMPVSPSIANVELTGRVLETMNAAGYTYLLLDTPAGKKWAASFEFEVRTGDVVHVQSSYEMTGFASPTLNRTFDRIYFASSMTLGTSSVNVVHGIPTGHHGADVEPAEEKPVEGITGKVIETMNAGGYTYVQVKASNETIWAATTRTEVKKGDRVTVPRGEVMKNFSSPTLKRTFDRIYFVGFITKEGAKPADMQVNPHGAWSDMNPPALAKPITQPAGGISIAEIHERKKQLAGKEVTVRGQVAKFSADIMGRNWIHLIDGSGSGQTASLVVTSAETTEAGRIITIRGRVAIDRNLGNGIAYPVMVDGASIAK